MTPHRLPGAFLALSCLVSTAAAGTVTLTPDQDATLYAENGDLSNGAGQHFFAGSNGMGAARRGLLRFDVAGALPAGATVTAVSLTLQMTQTSIGPQPVALHEVLASWGEGTSDAPGNEGGGAAASAGDASWTHRFYGTLTWTTPGGDFDPASSASLMVGALGPYTWTSTPAMVADVQGWLDNPAANRGWVLVGAETAAGTAKRFDSRQNPTVANRPQLAIEFEGGPFCNSSDGADLLCPCGNAGAAGAGCDLAQGTGGVRLDVDGFAPDGLGGGSATLLGTGFPVDTMPTAVVMRGPLLEAPPVVFGDGVRCVGASGLVRMSASFALGGSSVHPVMHGAGAGVFHYQIWLRNQPAMFCTPDAFNLSSGYTLMW